MLESTFDAVARTAATRISRRGSLLTLGGAGLAALAGPVQARAKKKSSIAKKARRLANRKCRQQVEECVTSLTQIGSEEAVPCCDFLADCDSAGHIQCLLNLVA
jgi:hypothetical protein